MNGQNSYEARRAARLERLRARADRKRAEGEASIASARQRAAIIPFGQPILVGHHSERRDRRYRERIEGSFRRGFEALNEARELERRADAAAENGAISSDDPEAIAKLRAKLEGLETKRAQAKEINARIHAAKRKGEGWRDVARAALAEAGLSERAIVAALEPDPLGNVGVPSFRLTNMAREARRIRERIAVLEREATASPVEPVAFGSIRVEEGDNRVRIVLPAKPGDETRALLKSRGFRWSPTAGAWQRQATDNARRDARYLAQKIAQQEGFGEGP